MSSYRAHVYDLYATALAKAAVVLVAYKECIRHRSECAEFPESLNELRTRFSDLQTAVEALFAAVPAEVAIAGNLQRHMYFGNLYINAQGSPGGWGVDAQLVLEHDLPAVLNAFSGWYETASGVDPELMTRLRPFNSASHINSAEREAWTIFKTRMTEAYDLPGNVDGHELVERLFGGNDPAVSFLSESERRGYHNLFKGLYTLHRNQIAHNDQGPNPAATDAVIALIGIYLSRIAPPGADAGR